MQTLKDFAVGDKVMIWLNKPDQASGPGYPSLTSTVRTVEATVVARHHRCAERVSLSFQDPPSDLKRWCNGGPSLDWTDEVVQNRQDHKWFMSFYPDWPVAPVPKPKEPITKTSDQLKLGDVIRYRPGDRAYTSTVIAIDAGRSDMLMVGNKEASSEDHPHPGYERRSILASFSTQVKDIAEYRWIHAIYEGRDYEVVSEPERSVADGMTGAFTQQEILSGKANEQVEPDVASESVISSIAILGGALLGAALTAINKGSASAASTRVATEPSLIEPDSQETAACYSNY